MLGRGTACWAGRAGRHLVLGPVIRLSTKILESFTDSSKANRAIIERVVGRSGVLMDNETKKDT